ncbi:MAG TPA: chemotaxis protein CheB [Clostridia bacterium]|nr:chemotaxis protein CheB [Clostridia bacterium]
MTREDIVTGFVTDPERLYFDTTASRKNAKNAKHPSGPTGKGRGEPQEKEMPGGRIRAKALVVIGSSTGGPSALEKLMRYMSPDIPAGLVIVQHMPVGFTVSLAARLHRLSPIPIREAMEGDVVRNGEALVAPGGRHLIVASDGTVTIDFGPPVNGVRPSVDVTLKSAVEAYGDKVVAVILTGMGSDGAAGALAVRRAGGRVFVQDEESSVVWGMPRAVIETAGADVILPPEYMPLYILTAVRSLLTRAPGDTEEVKG